MSYKKIVEWGKKWEVRGTEKPGELPETFLEAVTKLKKMHEQITTPDEKVSKLYLRYSQVRKELKELILQASIGSLSKEELASKLGTEVASKTIEKLYYLSTKA